MIAVSWIAFLVILYHSLRAAHRSSYCHWTGPRWRFAAISMGFACATSGSLGIALGVPWADHVFAIGAALYLTGNRRSCIAEAREDFLENLIPPGPPR